MKIGSYRLRTPRL